MTVLSEPMSGVLNIGAGENALLVALPFWLPFQPLVISGKIAAEKIGAEKIGGRRVKQIFAGLAVR